MDFKELQSKLIGLTNRNISQTEIGNALGIRRSTTSTRFKTKSQLKMSELEKVQLIKQLKIYDFEYEDIQTIVDILVSRNFLVSGILKASPESRQAVDYLLEFWDYDKSPYREERAVLGKNAIKPVNQRLFNKYLNRALEDCGYPNPEKIRFHCWKHAFCTEAKTLINDDRY